MSIHNRPMPPMLLLYCSHSSTDGVYGRKTMNMENLHELINRYEEKLDVFYNDEHDELFKWGGRR